VGDVLTVPVGGTSIDGIDWANGHGTTGTVIGDKSCWGKGIGSEVMRLRADFAFRELPFFATAQERVTLDSFWLATVAANYRVAPGVELFGRVENAFNDHHQEVYGFESAPIAAFAGVRLTYEEAQTVAWANGE